MIRLLLLVCFKIAEIIFGFVRDIILDFVEPIATKLIQVISWIWKKIPFRVHPVILQHLIACMVVGTVMSVCLYYIWGVFYHSGQPEELHIIPIEHVVEDMARDHGLEIMKSDMIFSSKDAFKKSQNILHQVQDPQDLFASGLVVINHGSIASYRKKFQQLYWTKESYYVGPVHMFRGDQFLGYDSTTGYTSIGRYKKVRNNWYWALAESLVVVLILYLIFCARERNLLDSQYEHNGPSSISELDILEFWKDHERFMKHNIRGKFGECTIKLIFYYKFIVQISQDEYDGRRELVLSTDRNAYTRADYANAFTIFLDKFARTIWIVTLYEKIVSKIVLLPGKRKWWSIDTDLLVAGMHLIKEDEELFKQLVQSAATGEEFLLLQGIR
jgi:hypothetical protein